jgi:glycine cleavage system H protein
MSNIPADLKYSKEHEWIKSEAANSAKVGITDYAQAALGDIVYVQLPKVGQEVKAGAVCGEVESTKSVSEIFSPLTGKVTAINSDLEKSPELINQDPYGAGWIAQIEFAATPEDLLSAEEYTNLTA